MKRDFLRKPRRLCMFLVETTIWRYFLEMLQSLRLRKLIFAAYKKSMPHLQHQHLFGGALKTWETPLSKFPIINVWNAIQKAHSCTHLSSKLSSRFSGRLNYIIWYYYQNRENFKLTATDILIYYKSAWYDLLSKEYFANETLRTLRIHLAVGHIWRGFYLFWKVRGIQVYKFFCHSKQAASVV